MENQTEQRILETVKELFEKAGFYFDNLGIEKQKGQGEQDLFIVKIDSKEDQPLLLDDKGKNLKAFEHIAKNLAAKELNQKINLILDLNNFLEKRNGKISELARLVAKKVQASQKSYVLSPMSAYERRLVHIELADWPDITTESIGEEPKRRVMIKPSL
ncbi:MAG: single-stranded nucleic acid binding R3H domain-containing protein [Parcubacteria group bacterium Gr01-1014_2]|nr:MAG: single-stranded nucleic acid binding R3H domain-containing protein [Parcubacteria group bacterium Gr01-1014_2]